MRASVYTHARAAVCIAALFAAGCAQIAGFDTDGAFLDEGPLLPATGGAGGGAGAGGDSAGSAGSAGEAAGQGGAAAAGMGGAGGKASAGDSGGGAPQGGEAGAGGEAAGAGGEPGVAGAGGEASAGMAGAAGAAGSAGVGGEGGAAGGAGEGGAAGSAGTGGGGAAGAGGAVCAKSSTLAPNTLPIDIIAMIDNDLALSPLIDGFGEKLKVLTGVLDGRALDYQIVVLSLRGTGTINVGGSDRHALCVPEPVAGPTCGDGPRFRHVDIALDGFTALEQLLGTLGQTTGYTPDFGPKNGGPGGEPWADALRVEAMKHLFVLTDYDARLAPATFQNFPGGANPFTNSGETLPPGILDKSWNGLFDGRWWFHGIYGWNNELMPSERCTYLDNTQPPKAGENYTKLVAQTKGVRGKVCDGQGAIETYFNELALHLTSTSRIVCEVPLGTAPDGAGALETLSLREQDTTTVTVLPRVDGPVGPVDCSPADGGWYVTTADPPTVVLCPATCDAVRAHVGVGRTGALEAGYACAAP